MRFGAASITRRTAFLDRPARGGSTTTTSGLPAFSTSSRMARRTSPAKKRALSMPLRRARSRSRRPRSPRQLDAEDLRGSVASDEADRAEPQ